MALMKMWVLIMLPLLASAEPEPSEELKKCVHDKLKHPMETCGDEGPTCKAECVSSIKAALPKLDGGCCELATKIPKDVCKKKIAEFANGAKTFVEKCPAQERLLEDDGPSPELKKCVHDKLKHPMETCGEDGPTCKADCVSSIKGALTKLDGSCCKLATKLPKDVCKKDIAGFNEHIQGFVDHCETTKLWTFDFEIEENSNSVPTSGISTSLLTGMCTIAVGATVLSLLVGWFRRRSSTREAEQALNVDDGDVALEDRDLE